MALHPPALSQTLSHLREFFAYRPTPANPQPISPELVPSAVLMPVVIDEDEALSLLFTKRSDQLKFHPGQISFPGGRMESGETSPWQTALREAEEEVGLSAQLFTYLGQMPTFHTPSGFSVTPTVGLIQAPLALKLNEQEVTQAFCVPFSVFFDEQYRTTRVGKPAYQWREHFIWGATAIMIDTLVLRLSQHGMRESPSS